MTVASDSTSRSSVTGMQHTLAITALNGNAKKN